MINPKKPLHRFVFKNRLGRAAVIAHSEASARRLLSVLEQLGRAEESTKLACDAGCRPGVEVYELGDEAGGLDGVERTAAMRGNEDDPTPSPATRYGRRHADARAKRWRKLCAVLGRDPELREALEAETGRTCERERPTPAAPPLSGAFGRGVEAVKRGAASRRARRG